MPQPSLARTQSVALSLRTRDGNATLNAFSFGQPYTVDPSKIWFTARRRLPVTLGTPVTVAHDGGNAAPGQQLDQYALPVTFPRTSDLEGMYDVQLHVSAGFAATVDGRPLPFGDWSRPVPEWHVNVWWPPRKADASLVRLMQRYQNRDVHAFGGIALGCPAWSAGYDARVPVHVRALQRERGRVEQLWTGSTMGWGDEMALNVFAIDPVRVIVDRPVGTPIFQGSGGWGGASADAGMACPAIVLADWQLEVTLSLEVPPVSYHPGRWRPRLGMSRAQVAWDIGFPYSFSGRATLEKSAAWSYQGGPKSSLTVEFAGDRVASVHS